MNTTPLSTYIAACLSLHGIEMSAGNPAAILDHATRNLEAYELVASFDLPEAIDAAPIFKVTGND